MYLRTTCTTHKFFDFVKYLGNLHKIMGIIQDPYQKFSVKKSGVPATLYEKRKRKICDTF
jgi:hypothetical protein